VKDDTQATTPPEKLSPKALPDQAGPENRGQSQGTFGKSRANGQPSDPEDMDVSHAETATMLKKHFQLVKRRKRWLKATGLVGVMMMLLGGICTWLWTENEAFKMATLQGLSTVMSIYVEPEMITIPGGTFRQGNIHGEDGNLYGMLILKSLPWGNLKSHSKNTTDSLSRRIGRCREMRAGGVETGRSSTSLGKTL